MLLLRAIARCLVLIVPQLASAEAEAEDGTSPLPFPGEHSLVGDATQQGHPFGTIYSYFDRDLASKNFFLAPSGDGPRPETLGSSQTVPQQ